MNINDDTHHPLIHSNKADIIRMIMMAKRYSGNHVAYSPDICHTGEENPNKTSPRKLVPTGDLTRARCVTGAHAIALPKAVDVHSRGE